MRGRKRFVGVALDTSLLRIQQGAHLLAECFRMEPKSDRPNSGRRLQQLVQQDRHTQDDMN